MKETNATVVAVVAADAVMAATAATTAVITLVAAATAAEASAVDQRRKLPTLSSIPEKRRRWNTLKRDLKPC